MSIYVSSVDDLAKITITRRTLDKWVHSAAFSHLPSGCFVRVADGLDPDDPTKTLYRIAEIVDVVETRKKYQLGQAWINQAIKVRYGNYYKLFRLYLISDLKFTQDEFHHWLNDCRENKVELPIMDDVLKKVQAIQNANNSEHFPGNEGGFNHEGSSALHSNDVPPETLVFSIDLVHSMILSNLSVDSLKTIRLVNSHWCSAANELLSIVYSPLCIEFDFDLDMDSFLHQVTDSTTGETIERTLGELVELLDNCIPDLEFPCSDYTFIGGYLTNVQFQQFLDAHGSIIESLTLSLLDDDSECREFSTLDDFHKLLTEQAPNLEYLCIIYFPRQWVKNVELGTKSIFGGSGVNVDVVYLPNLKTLDLEDVLPSEILLDLLRACVNLEDLYIPELNLPVVTYLVESGRLYLLRSFKFRCTPTNLLAYETFSDTKSKLSSINVSWTYSDYQARHPYYPRIARCLSSILASSSETLKTAHLCPIGHLSGFFMPVLTKVRELSVEDPDSNPLRDVENVNPPVQSAASTTLFPVGMSMKSIFPNLTTVCLNNFDAVNDRFIENFEPLPTVKKLSISNAKCFSEGMIEKFSLMFPNVSQGIFEGIHNFSKIAKPIWKFSKLKELRLGFVVDCSCACCHSDVYPPLDVEFTGLGHETYRTLLIMSEDEIGEKLNENLLRENASLLHLKELKSLSMEFGDDGNELNDLDCMPLMTELTGKYAFRFHPNAISVDVRITAEGPFNFSKIKTRLDQIRPYVTSGSW